MIPMKRKGGRWRWELSGATTPSGKALWRCSRCGLEAPTPDKWEYHQAICLTRKPPRVYPLAVFSLGDESEYLVSKGHHDPHTFFTAACQFATDEACEPVAYLFGWPTSEWATYVTHAWARWVTKRMASWSGSDCDQFLVIGDGANGPVTPGPGAFPITYVKTYR